MCEVNEVSVWVTEVRLHPAQSEDNIPIPFTGQILGCVQGFVEGDPKASLDQDRVVILATGTLEKLEILRISCTDLQHDSRGMSGCFQCFGNLLNMRLVGYLHGNNTDAILAGQFKDIRETVFPVPLEGIGACPWLVGSHAGTDKSMLLQLLEHAFYMLRRIYGTQAGKYMETRLTECDSIVFKLMRKVFLSMSSKHPVCFLHTNNTLYAGKAPHEAVRKRFGISQEIDLCQELSSPLDVPDLIGNICE